MQGIWYWPPYLLVSAACSSKMQGSATIKGRSDKGTHIVWDTICSLGEASSKRSSLGASAKETQQMMARVSM